MFEYSQEELLEKIEKALNQSGVSNLQSAKENKEMIGVFVSAILKVLRDNSSVNVKNTAREVTNEIKIKKPKWIHELKKDDSNLERELKHIVAAIQAKPLVKEVDIKQSSWLKAALRKNKPVERDYTQVLEGILKEVRKEIEIPSKMKVSGNVAITEPVSVRRPSWYKGETYSDALKRIVHILTNPLSVKVQNSIKLEKEVLDVQVKDNINIGNTVEVIIRDGRGRVIDLDRQFGRISTGGSTGGIKNVILQAIHVDTGEATDLMCETNDSGQISLITSGSGSTPSTETGEWDSTTASWDSTTSGWDATT